MNNNNKPTSNRRRSKSSKFNPKDINSLTIKELADRYQEALEFIKACESTIGKIINIPTPRAINNGIYSGRSNEDSYDYESPVLERGSVVDIGGVLSSSITEYPQDVYIPPILDSMDSSNEYDSVYTTPKLDLELDNEDLSSIQDDLVKILKQVTE